VRTQEVIIHRPGPPTTDPYGNEVPGPTTDIPVRAYRVGPVRALELTEGRQTVVTSAAGSFPLGTDIRPTDELTADGKRYRVLGVLPVRGVTIGHVRADLEAIS
jgi:hypothetical protein